MRSALSPNRTVSQIRANQSRLDQSVQSALDGTKAAIKSGASRHPNAGANAARALASAGIGRHVDRRA